MKQQVTIKELQGKYRQLYQDNKETSQEGYGRSSAYLDLSQELAMIATYSTKAAQKRQLKRMIDCYNDMWLNDEQDPKYKAKYRAFHEAVDELKKINTFIVL